MDMPPEVRPYEKPQEKIADYTFGAEDLKGGGVESPVISIETGPEEQTVVLEGGKEAGIAISLDDLSLIHPAGEKGYAVDMEGNTYQGFLAHGIGKNTGKIIFIFEAGQKPTNRIDKVQIENPNTGSEEETEETE